MNTNIIIIGEMPIESRIYVTNEVFNIMTHNINTEIKQFRGAGYLYCKLTDYGLLANNLYSCGLISACGNDYSKFIKSKFNQYRHDGIKSFNLPHYTTKKYISNQDEDSPYNRYIVKSRWNCNINDLIEFKTLVGKQLFEKNKKTSCIVLIDEDYGLIDRSIIDLIVKYKSIYNNKTLVIAPCLRNIEAYYDSFKGTNKNIHLLFNVETIRVIQGIHHDKQEALIDLYRLFQNENITISILRDDHMINSINRDGYSEFLIYNNYKYNDNSFMDFTCNYIRSLYVKIDHKSILENTTRLMYK